MCRKNRGLNSRRGESHESRSSSMDSLHIQHSVLKPQRFSEEQVELWRAGKEGFILCKTCNGEKKGRGASLEVWRCSNCREEWPSNHFRESSYDANAVVRWCARCEASGDAKLEAIYRCVACNKDKKLREYAPVLIKNVVFRGPAAENGGGSRPCGFRCQSCQYPTCQGLNGNECRAPHVKVFYPPPRTCYYKGCYLCSACKYPPCECGQERPRDAQSGAFKGDWSATKGGFYENWKCATCRSEERLEETNRCTICKGEYPKTERHWDMKSEEPWRARRCLNCQYPTCATPGCGRQHPKTEAASEHTTEQYFCAECSQTMTCVTCKKAKGKADFDKETIRWAMSHGLEPRCRDCEKEATEERVACRSCDSTKEVTDFDARDILAYKSKTQKTLTCKTCKAKRAEKKKTETFPCRNCGLKAQEDFDDMDVKNYKRGTGKTKTIRCKQCKTKAE